MERNYPDLVQLFKDVLPGSLPPFPNRGLLTESIEDAGEMVVVCIDTFVNKGGFNPAEDVRFKNWKQLFEFNDSDVSMDSTNSTNNDSRSHSPSVDVVMDSPKPTDEPMDSPNPPV